MTGFAGRVGLSLEDFMDYKQEEEARKKQNEKIGFRVLNRKVRLDNYDDGRFFSIPKMKTLVDETKYQYFDKNELTWKDFPIERDVEYIDWRTGKTDRFS
jgi:hypothetical protein